MLQVSGKHFTWSTNSQNGFGHPFPFENLKSIQLFRSPNNSRAETFHENLYRNIVKFTSLKLSTCLFVGAVTVDAVIVVVCAS